MTPEFRQKLIQQTSRRLLDHIEELGQLDRAIGDGDHGLNMRRGVQAVLGEVSVLSEASLPDMLDKIGKHLLMSVGGASGPIYATLLMSLGKTLSSDPTIKELRSAVQQGVIAVGARGKVSPGQKTLLDVLAAVEYHLNSTFSPTPQSIRAVAIDAAERTIPMQARRGRAAMLGARSIGHMDPGARSASLSIAAICDTFGEMDRNV